MQFACCNSPRKNEDSAPQRSLGRVEKVIVGWGLRDVEKTAEFANVLSDGMLANLGPYRMKMLMPKVAAEGAFLVLRPFRLAPH